MKITNNQLIGLKVLTESGNELGTVETFDVEVETQSILEYIIRPGSRIKELIQGELIINRGQVIEIRESEMVVDDNIGSHPNLKKLAEVLKRRKNNEVPVTNKNS